MEDYPSTGMVAFSGGKDSAAMLLRMLELWIEGDKRYPITKITFADTGFELPELIDYIRMIEAYIQATYPELNLSIDFVGSPRSWEDWFYGEITKGANKGKQRGAPLRAYPCYWAREAKVQPLQKAQADCDVVYIGIAADEAHRVGKKEDPRNAKNRYPLVDWGWTEKDCMRYLDERGLVNELYVNFNRLGCFHCIKQPLDSWWSLWRGYPELWEIAKHWDEESVRISNHGLRSMKPGKDGYLLEELEERFKQGYKPVNKKGLYDCNSCKAVSFTATGQMRLEDFDSDDAPEMIDEKFIDEEPPACDMLAPANEIVNFVKIEEETKWKKD